jgi:sugar lactone lactonase YvrE
LKLDGTIEELRWVAKLKAPAGLAMHGNKLFTVERGAIVEIDMDTGSILQRYPVPESDFMNDVVSDSDGTLYITDTRPSSHADSCIFRFKDGVAEKWYDTFEISRSNGIFLDNDELYVGNTGDGLLKAINVESKVIRRIIALGGGVLDGIRRDNAGNLLVSHWEGPVFSISPDGMVTEIGDLSKERLNAADFEYLTDDGLLIVPTFLGNKVVAYKVKDVQE